MDKFDKAFGGYLVVVASFLFLEEPGAGIAFATWILGAMLLFQNDDYYILAILWWFLGIIPSSYIAMFIVDLFK
jgi:uncharacterized membrane protein HdeD (DUF308 family)